MQDAIVQLPSMEFGNVLLEGPVWLEQYSTFKCFPMIDSYAEDVENHPLIVALKAGKPIEAVETHNTWRDDHCDCMDVVLTVDGKKYGVSTWWLSPDGVKMLYQAEGGKTSALAKATEHFKACL